MHSEFDEIMLTPKGHNIAEALESGEPGTGTIADDIIAYLDKSPNMRAACGEIGMNIKISGDELKEVLQKLESHGFVIHMPAKRGAGFGSYRGGIAPHEYLGQEVEEHAIAEPTEALRRNLDDNYKEECDEDGQC